MKYVKLLLMLFIALNLSACHSLLSKIHIIDIQQGNIITPEQIQKLHTGMSKTEVAELLGNPVLHDLFNNNRWDYIYTLEKPHYALQKQRLTIYFAQDHLTHIDQIGYQ